MPELRPDATPASKGVACTKCGCRHCPVNYTRHTNTGSQTRRSRTCRACGNRFRTTEIVCEAVDGRRRQ